MMQCLDNHTPSDDTTSRESSVSDSLSRLEENLRAPSASPASTLSPTAATELGVKPVFDVRATFDAVKKRGASAASTAASAGEKSGSGKTSQSGSKMGKAGKNFFRAGKTAKKIKRPLPPGQRLVRALGCATILSAVLGFVSPLTGPCENIKAGAAALVPLAAPFELNHELKDLHDQIETACQIKKLSPGVFVVDPVSGAYVDYHGHDNFAAASMIKVPVLVALFSAIDRGEIDPKKVLTMRQDLVAGGSGILQWRPVGTKLPLMTVADLMITVSDNTATNMVIDLLGGKEAVNKRFTAWGLKNTVIRNWLADLPGTNRTSPYDMVFLLGRVEKGELMSNVWRDKMRAIMYRTKTKTLLNPGLPPGAKLAHKTGDIGSMVGDTGVVTTVDGRQYFVAVQVQRPHNDRRANELIRKLSGMIYTAYVAQPKPLDEKTREKLLNPRVLENPQEDAVKIIEDAQKH